jgi:dienelactone hydrolase
MKSRSTSFFYFFARLACLVVLLLSFAIGRLNALEAERLFYLSNGEVLEGCIYKPAARGVFPAVVFIQGRGAKPLPAQGPLDPYPKIAEFYTSRNYVLFIPGRHKASKNTDVNEGAGASTNETENESEKLLRGFEKETEVIFAAVEALKAHSCVNARKIFISGFGSGGTLTLMLARKPLDVRGYVAFSPAVESWDEKPFLQAALKQAVREAHAPVFLIQPENDTSLGPSDGLAKGRCQPQQSFFPEAQSGKARPGFRHQCARRLGTRRDFIF